MHFDTLSARYGASLVTLLFAVYLQINNNFAQFVQSVSLHSGMGADITALLGFQFFFVVSCFVAAFLMAPTTLPRRLIAAGAAVVLLVIWAVFFAGRITGSITLPGGPFLSTVFVSSAYVGALVAVLGWLIVRERPGLSYLVVLLMPLIGVVSWFLLRAAAPAGVTLIVTTLVTAIIGVGAAWAARGLASLVQRTPGDGVPAAQAPVP